MARNGEMVAAFERELAAYCGAKYCVAAANGTVTLSAALSALGIKPGDRVSVPPLTMAASTISILNVGAVPVFCDVDPDTWIMPPTDVAPVSMGVSLYGLHGYSGWSIDDAAQTLKPHDRHVSFTSLSHQASKILALGEGGALLTDDEELAAKARSYLSLGYQMDPAVPRIDPALLKDPNFARHHLYPAINGRMNDLTAAKGLEELNFVGALLENRRQAALHYRDAIEGCDWLTPQHVPDGWQHDYWAFSFACDTPERATQLRQTMGRLGAEIPYPAWMLTYREPAFKHLAYEYPTRFCQECGNDYEEKYRTPKVVSCPVAESLQPRLLQFQTNNLASAEQNARALRRAIGELS